MLAYHGDPAIKAKYMRRVQAHRRADRLVQGIGADGEGKGFRGCAVGCTLEVYDHSRYPIELGVPEELARLEDCIFEGLKPAAAMKWPTQFLSAIRPGADLALVWPRFALWLLEVELKDYPTGEPVAALYRRWLAGYKPSGEEWRAAAWAAWAAEAAAGAARAAAGAAAAAAWAAEAAVGAVGAVGAARAARAAAWDRYAKKLLQLLRAAGKTA